MFSTNVAALIFTLLDCTVAMVMTQEKCPEAEKIYFSEYGPASKFVGVMSGQTV